MNKNNSSFRDDSGNQVTEVFSPDTRFRVLQLVETPTIGYVTDAQWGDIYPGPVLTWFGPGERYATLEQALEACASGPRS